MLTQNPTKRSAQRQWEELANLQQHTASRLQAHTSDPHPVLQALRDSGQWEELADTCKMADSSDTMHAPGPRVTATRQRNANDQSLNEKQSVGLCPQSRGHHIKVYAFERQTQNTEKRKQPLIARVNHRPRSSFISLSLTYYNVIQVVWKINEMSDRDEVHNEVGRAVNST